MKHRCELRLRPACRMLAVTTSAIIALSLFPIELRAQDYPNRTVKIVVPFPAGGTADVMPRVVADWLSRKWGQSVIIENKTGAAGNIGADRRQRGPGRLHAALRSATTAGDQPIALSQAWL